MKSKNSGLTLVEVLVVVTILSVLALSVYTVFKSGVDAWSKAEERLDIYQNARVVLDQISRELVGAFVTSGATGAKLVGTPGATATDPDTLAFITDFSDSVYKIHYNIITDGADPQGRNILQRDYIDYSDPTKALETYASVNYDGTEFVKYTKNTVVSNIKFTYLPVMASPTGLNDWNTTAVALWTNSDLPEAVKIILTLKDANGNSHVFETIVYLPNSEVE